MKRILLYVSCYGILFWATPILLLAHIFDGFVRTACDAWGFHKYIQSKL